MIVKDDSIARIQADLNLILRLHHEMSETVIGVQIWFHDRFWQVLGCGSPGVESDA